MARVKIILPQNFCFETEIKVMIGDINYGGHLSNDSLLRIAHEARIEFLKQCHFSENDIGSGLGLIMADAQLVYKSQAFQGDVLKVELAFSEITDFSFDFLYKITKKENFSEVSRIKTGMVAFNYEQKKIGRLPENFVAQLNKNNSKFVI